MLIGFKHRLAERSMIDQLIARWTRSDWVHCELIFESYGNMCISARPGETAVSVKPFNEVVRNEFWSFYRVPGIDAGKEREVMNYLLAQSVTEYNYSGLIWSHVLRNARLVPGQWFCSELCYWVLWSYSTIDITFAYPASVAPNQLRELVRKTCEGVILPIQKNP